MRDHRIKWGISLGASAIVVFFSHSDPHKEITP